MAHEAFVRSLVYTQPNTNTLARTQTDHTRTSARAHAHPRILWIRDTHAHPRIRTPAHPLPRDLGFTGCVSVEFPVRALRGASAHHPPESDPRLPHRRHVPSVAPLGLRRHELSCTPYAIKRHTRTEGALVEPCKNPRRRRCAARMQAPPRNAPPVCRILLLGGGGVGKTALTLRYMKDIFVDELDPTSSSSSRPSFALIVTPYNIFVRPFTLCWRSERSQNQTCSHMGLAYLLPQSRTSTERRSLSMASNRY